MFYSDEVDCGPSIKQSLQIFLFMQKKNKTLSVCEMIVELAESIMYATSIVAMASFFFFSLNYQFFITSFLYICEIISFYLRHTKKLKTFQNLKMLDINRHSLDNATETADLWPKGLKLEARMSQ